MHHLYPIFYQKLFSILKIRAFVLIKTLYTDKKKTHTIIKAIYYYKIRPEFINQRHFTIPSIYYIIQYFTLKKKQRITYINPFDAYAMKINKKKHMRSDALYCIYCFTRKSIYFHNNERI